MEWNVESLNALFDIKDGLETLTLSEEDLLPVKSYWEGRPGMHSEEGKRDIAEAIRKRDSRYWRLTHKDGSIEEVYNLEKYCRDRGWYSGNLFKLGKIDKKGYVVKCRYGVIKLEELNKE